MNDDETMTLPELLSRVAALEQRMGPPRWKSKGALELVQEWLWREREGRTALERVPRATGSAVTDAAALRDLFEALAYGAELVAGYIYADSSTWPSWVRAGEDAAVAAAWVEERRADMTREFARVLAR